MSTSFGSVALSLALLTALTGAGPAAAQESCSELPELIELLDPPGRSEEQRAFSVAVDGLVAVVGVPRDAVAGYGTGRVVVYEWGLGGWTLTAVLRDDVVRSLTEFGFAVDVEGDLIAVGARVDDEMEPDAGAVHLFRRQPDGTWLHEQRLQANDAAWGAQFGVAVAVDGPLLAVGARHAANDSVPLEDSGAAYVFEDDGTGRFVETTRVTAPTPQAGAWFGGSVALDEGVLIVGEPRRDLGGRANAGAAHAYGREADGSWSWEAELTTPGQMAGDAAGIDVTIEAELVVVGSQSGETVRSWRRAAPGAWSLESELTHDDPMVRNFGSALALHSGRLVVGASHQREPSGAFAYAFDGAGGWTLHEELVPADIGRVNVRSLDWDGRRVILGSWEHSHEAFRDGGAWLFGCNPPPDCDAGPSTLEADCDGLALSGSANDPFERPLSVSWTSDCADLVFSPSADRLDPTVSADSACERDCELTLTVSAEDGATCSDSLRLHIDDERPPDLAVPASLVVECSGPGGVPAVDPAIAAWLASAMASDSCSGVVIENDAPAFFVSGCAPGAVTVVRFTARDACGNETQGEAEVTVVDTTPPTDLVVPPTLSLECSGPGGIPAGDPLIAAWLGSATAVDACSGVAIEHDAPGFFVSGCPPGAVTVVRFTARDACGNETQEEAEVIVVDSTPPTVEAGSEVLAELWAPNHRWRHVSAESLIVSVADGCDPAPARWRLAGCESDEPADGQGDGHTSSDCIIDADGQGLLLRAERSGGGSGRLYELLIEAADTCDNWSAPVMIGLVRVRHDQRR